jgi:hypothetical protein
LRIGFRFVGDNDSGFHEKGTAAGNPCLWQIGHTPDKSEKPIVSTPRSRPVRILGRRRPVRFGTPAQASHAIDVANRHDRSRWLRIESIYLDLVAGDRSQQRDRLFRMIDIDVVNVIDFSF